MKQLTGCILLATLLVSCASHNNTKRILVVAKGSADINTDTKTITLTNGAGTEEKSADFNSAEKLSLTLKKEDGDVTVDIPESGYYLLNAKNDTIVGSYQKYGAPKTSYETVKQETILKGIDSLQQLIQGINVSAANRNFYILPYHAVKITNNLDAFLVTPFHQMTSIEKTDNKEPEVYRFYSVKEVRETIQRLKVLSTPTKK
jgi:hypothetical protein